MARPKKEPSNPFLGKTGHFCHFYKCGIECAPRYLGCQKHWFKVPPSIQKRVYGAYSPGQEILRTYSAEWFFWAEVAIITVAEKEGYSEWAQNRREFLARNILKPPPRFYGFGTLEEKPRLGTEVHAPPQAPPLPPLPPSIPPLPAFVV